MSMCVISACKSAIVSPYTPALYGTQNSPVLNHCVGCPHLFNLWTWLYITPLPLQIRQSCHYDDPRVNKLHNSDNTLKQYHQYYYCFDHQNITTVFWSSQLWLFCKKQIDKYVLPSMNTIKHHHSVRCRLVPWKQAWYLYAWYNRDCL